ncbi:major surface protease gp63 [Novymonas esmeraldas]|uniref:Leishmanolysin-like peptidase n=1 Tax=Novymonas esmeraldas TaxID=1808958 RepID=A0AAW0EZF1_9TRYP
MPTHAPRTQRRSRALVAAAAATSLALVGLLALSHATPVAASAAAGAIPLHVDLMPALPTEHEHIGCGFDAVEAKAAGTRISGISHVRSSSAPSDQRGAEAAAASAAWQPLRIRVFTDDVDDASRYCTAVGQSRRDFQGGSATCTADDVLTAAKKRTLKDLLVPAAIQLHQERLNVQRVSGNIVVGSSIASDSLCGQFSIPAAHTRAGVSDADFILYLAAGPTSGNVIAWATTCQYFSDGRPSVGIANVSPKYIAADPQTVRVITHELLHALGFSINTFSARGMVSFERLRGKGVKPVISSHNVVAKAKAQYGCGTQAFMELEDMGGRGTAYSHWKRRSAKDELMAGISGVGYYTALTIAAMEDMGFYKGNYAQAEQMSFGQGAGCSLTTDKCLTSGVSSFPSMFCASATGDMSCTTDHRALGYCYVGRYNAALPTYFRYFADATLGGGDSLMDYCPYTQAYLNTNCSTNTGVLLGNTYGIASRCLNTPAGFVQGGYYVKSQLAICADVRCGATTYAVRVAGATAYTACTPGSNITLATLDSNFTSGYLVCPSYDAVCGGETVRGDARAFGSSNSEASAVTEQSGADQGTRGNGVLPTEENTLGDLSALVQGEWRRMVSAVIVFSLMFVVL